jgi:uncharacterized OB-fold protein
MESTAPSQDPTTVAQPALATVAGDQCTSCGAPLAPDQRYCVQCGQRRGQSRLPVTQPVAVREHTAVRRSRLQSFSGNAALIAGVGTLLLAMGVGVLIGRSGQKASPARAASPVQVVTVGGGAAGTSTAATAAAGGKAIKAGKKTGKSATAADVAKAATKIKGTSIKLPKKSVVKVGSPGTGPGYQKGKFTGNFFGGG